MNEFLRELEVALRGNIPDSYVRSNVEYYREYFKQEKAKGLKEKEIVQMLGEPRLIAKNIIDTSPLRNEKPNGGYYEEFREDNITSDEKHGEYEEFVSKQQKKYEKAGKTINFLDRLTKSIFGKILLYLGIGVIAIVVIWLVIQILSIFVAYVLPVLALVAMIKLIIYLIKSR